MNSDYLRGSLGTYAPQKILMLQDHSVCLINMQLMSLKQTLMHSFLCLKFKILHCLMKKHLVYSSLAKSHFLQLQNSRFCGSILLQEKPIQSHKENILIGVTRGHSIHISMLRFHFFLSNHISCHKHGMSLVYTKVESETYCGFRVPWDIIVKRNQMFIHLSIRELKYYSVELFYSNFRPSWITNLSLALTIYSDGSPSFYFITPFTFFDKNVKSYTYNVMSHHENYLLIHVSANNLFKTHIIIYDGPGNLARNLLEVNDAQQTIYRYIRTTAFMAFIDIKLLDSGLNYSKIINITTKYSKQKVDDCVYLQRGLIEAKSNKWKNMACMRKFELFMYEIQIIFRAFKFVGPNMLTMLSNSVCQYGGLFVEFNSREQQYEFCESIDYDYILRSSNKSLTLIVVWFSGYSQGKLRANLMSSDCRTSHAEFYLSKSTLLLPNILHKQTLSQYCEIFICPALLNHHQMRFTVQFGPYSLGTIRLEVIQFYTLSACEPDVKYDHRPEVSIRSISLENWPLHSTPNISQIDYNISDRFVMTFAYLHEANVSLGYICKPEMTRLQMAIQVTQSSCQKWANMNHIVNNIPSLSASCQQISKHIRYFFTPTNNDSKGYIDFIYKDTGHINDGFDLEVKYLKCPMICRNYRYRLLVRMVDDKTVLEYKTSVGQSISTGKYHRGVRVTILPPDPLCDQHLLCELHLHIPHGGIKDVAQNPIHEQSTLHFYEKR